MTDFLVWRDSWELGIDELDADHQEMVRLMNGLMELRARYIEHMEKGPGQAKEPPAPKAFQQRMDQLLAHVRAHFDREERFLRAIDYPGYVEHRREHIMQMAEFTDLRRCMERDAAPCMDPQSVQNFKDWFFNHVIAEDRRYAEYFFRECGGRVPNPRPGEVDRTDPASGESDSIRPDARDPGEPAQ